MVENFDHSQSETQIGKRGSVSKVLFGLFWLFLLLAAVCAAVLLVAGPNGYLLAGLEISVLFGLGFFILYKKQQHGVAIGLINATATRIEDTQLKLVSFNNHIHALNRFTNALSEAADLNNVCQLVARMLVEDFKFDSSQFWVLDPHRKHLKCVCTEGYTADQIKKYFRATPTEQSVRQLNALLNQVLKSGETLAVSDRLGTINDSNERISNFRNLLNLSSFVATPLGSANRAIGVLTAEFHSGTMLSNDDVRTVEFVSRTAAEAMAKDELKILGEKDRLLVESLSNVVGDALVKLELFDDMENQIEQRTRELQRLNEKLLKTREIAIQSEKLSSLGRMAAGVIHQISDPLNFLVNIMPDLKNDFEGLGKAKKLIQKRISDPAVKEEIKAISKKYDLDSHLSDMDFVFERAIKALEKSTRIARRLSVFTSSSDQEIVEIVDLLQTAQEAIDMLPTKLIGETSIHIHRQEPVLLRCVASEMQQVFLNLINNAVDAMAQKGQIDIHGRKDEQGILISVCDDGPGIPDKIQSQIFDPFFTTKPAGQSTGLGLSISAEIVRKYDGSMTVDSAEGKGTCFQIVFRAKESTAADSSGDDGLN